MEKDRNGNFIQVNLPLPCKGAAEVENPQTVVPVSIVILPQHNPIFGKEIVKQKRINDGRGVIHKGKVVTARVFFIYSIGKYIFCSGIECGNEAVY